MTVKGGLHSSGLTKVRADTFYLNQLEQGKTGTDTPDDEFDSTTLDGKWTVVSGTSSTVDLLSTAAEEIYDLTTRPGNLLTQISSNNSVELRQDYTLPDGNSIILSVSPSQQGRSTANNELEIGLGLNDTNTGAFDGIENLLYIDTEGVGNWRVLLADGAGSQGQATNVTIGMTYYLRLHRSGLTYYAFYSINGCAWINMGFTTVGTAHNNVWIFHRSSATIDTPNPICAFHWIRQGNGTIDPF